MGMADRPIRIRRGRRTDFTAVMELLAVSGEAVPPPDRATLRRFRHLVADLGCDFYLATVDERVVGVAHVTYARQLAAAPLATLATLVVGESSRGHGVDTALIEFAEARARKRACVALRYVASGSPAGVGRQSVLGAGARPVGTMVEVPLLQED